MVVTEFLEDFSHFYESFLEDSGKAEECNRLLYNTENYSNVLGITSMPDLHFSSFAFGTEVKPDLTPFVVIGKYEKKDNRIILPVCGEFAHSVNDGFHISQFFRELKIQIDSFEG